jgi:transposase
MSMTKRRNFSDTFNVAVALEALRGDKTVHEIAAKRNGVPTMLTIRFVPAMDRVFVKVQKPDNLSVDLALIQQKNRICAPGNPMFVTVAAHTELKF